VNGYPFIFSNRFPYRLLRHLAFWIVFLGHYAVQNIIITGSSGTGYFRSLPQLFLYIAFFFPAFVVSAYFFMYVIIPAFLYTRRFVPFLLSFTGLIISNFVVATLMAKLYIHTTVLIHNNQAEYGQYKYYAVANGIWIPLILLSLVCGILLSKKWMLQQTANEILIKENISKELKLLKTRIHPRFLFHSLNSLEGKLRNELPESPNLILKMSELLSYVLFGSEGDYVLLEKELEVIREYIDLQKNNHHDKIQISLEIKDEANDSYLAPLILLPFLETSFEYLMVMDASLKKMDVRIRATEGILYFNLTCTEDYPTEAKFYQQPMWSDITKRIETLYPDNHQLILKSNNHEIVIELQLNMIHSAKDGRLIEGVLNENQEYA